MMCQRLLHILKSCGMPRYITYSTQETLVSRHIHSHSLSLYCSLTHSHTHSQRHSPFSLSLSVCLTHTLTLTHTHTHTHLCLPHEPELEDVHVSAALYGLVPGVVVDVVLFVWLEQVASTHGVAALQQTLIPTQTTSQYIITMPY